MLRKCFKVQDYKKLKEEYYDKWISNVRKLLLDNYCKLFKVLLKRQLPEHILHVIINLYTNSCVLVAWGAITSDY